MDGVLVVGLVVGLVVLIVGLQGVQMVAWLLELGPPLDRTEAAQIGPPWLGGLKLV